MNVWTWTVALSKLDAYSTQNKAWSRDTHDKPTEFEFKIMMKISTSVCVIGTVSNLLSLTFFFLNWSNKLGEKLLVLLNMLDLLVCLSATLNLGCKELLDIDSQYPRVGRLLSATYNTSVDCTGFVTSLLTVVRTLATYYPFYEPKQRYITVGFLAFAVYSSSKPFWCVTQSYNILLLLTLSLNIVLVLTANFLTARKLLKSGNLSSSRAVSISNRKNRHATITIFILSACFCFLNFLDVIMLFNYILERETISPVFRQLIARISIPLNSAINPFVYFFRKGEMRRFLCRFKCCQSSVRQRNVVQNLPNFPPPSNNHSNRLGCPTVEVETNVSIKLN